MTAKVYLVQQPRVDRICKTAAGINNNNDYYQHLQIR